MARFLRWLMGLDDIESLLEYGADAHALRQRLELRVSDLSLDVTRLEMALERLRGLVTGPLSRGRRARHEADLDLPDDLPDDEEDDDVQQRVLDMIERRRAGA